ncbi:hypothetical protein C0J52_14953, partial [Blattella germanica]
VKKLTEKIEATERNLSKFLRADQFQYLLRVSDTNPYTWTNIIFQRIEDNESVYVSQQHMSLKCCNKLATIAMLRLKRSQINGTDTISGKRL